ncbi:hypothetical protein CIPAW_09G096200 [Carya illinoinensis]|uniref:Uncharacterized protein n=1 Tax=Carya illinoinensis TaxID=32201 RepID=A0A8T1PFP7_CARIL|nr:hypothetical protein CIPAW_09G096200 [Carya illinoinensis]
MNLDLTLRIDAPIEPTSENSAAEKTPYEKWMHSNRTCLIIMKYTIDKLIRLSISDTDSTKEYLDAVGKKFIKFDKAENGTLMKLLTTTTYDEVSGVREHIMKLTHFFNKLKGMKVELADSFLFDALKTTYNAQKDEWSLSEMTAIVTQEEEMMRKAKSHAAFMVTVDKGKKKFFKSNSNNFYKMKKYGKPPQQAGMSIPNRPKKEVFKRKCNFCHLFGHKSIDCRRFKSWLDKKGTHSLLVCFESNLVDVHSDTWWLDTGATIHITNSLQELRNRRKPNDTELKLNTLVQSYLFWLLNIF